MKGQALAGVMATALGLLLSCPAFALKITVAAAPPVPIGQPQTFRIATVADAVGAVVVHWDFGDAVTTDAPGDATVMHAYTAPGHYSVLIKASDDVANGYATLVQAVHYPLTTTPPHNTTSILIDEGHHEVWNVNPDSDSVTVSDSTSGAKLHEIPVGKEPHALAQAPDGAIWVANQLSDEVVVVDRSTSTVRERIPLAYASQPRSVVFSPSGGSAYVSLSATGRLVEIDTASRKQRRDVMLGPSPWGISVASGGQIYVTRFNSPVDHGEVWVVAPDTLSLTNTVVLPFDQNVDSPTNGRGVPNFVASFAISPDGRQAWVTAEKPNVARGPQRDGLHMNSDSFVRSIICVVDLATGMELVDKRLDLDNRNMPVAVAFSPVGDYGYVVLESNNEVSFQDGYNLTNIGAIKNVGNAPDGVVLGQDGKLWANAFLSREVLAYDMRLSLSSEDQTAPGPASRTRTIDKEPLADQVLLGKQVFFNAADPRMNRVGYMSCVSCHFNGFTDGRTWDFTDRGEGLRNTKSLLGIRGAQGEGRIHWSANMDEIQDFERDIRDSLEGFGFMPQAEFDARKDSAGHYDTFGKPAAGVSKELDGLAAYLTSLDKVPRSPFRNPDGSFTAAALEGRAIFKRAGCDQCHNGPDFTDSSSGVVHDVGTLLPTSGSRLFGKLNGIDTPTLKGVWQTAPYYHDGRAATLMDIFTKYNVNDQMGVTSNLSGTELSQLVEYLLELDDVPEPPTPGETSAVRGACSVAPQSPTWRNVGLSVLVIGLAICVGVARRRGRRRPGRSAAPS